MKVMFCQSQLLGWIAVLVRIVSAFQTTSLSSIPVGRTRLSMADTLYPYGTSGSSAIKSDAVFSNPSSLLTPLFHDTEWYSSRQHYRRGLFSSSMMTGSNFSFLNESNLDDDDDDVSLSYLPSGGAGLAPKTKALLQRLTAQYVAGREPAVQVQEVVDVIDDEYRSYDVPVNIGQATFDVGATGNDSDGDAARILSFAALHRIPRDIALLLFGEPSSGRDKLAECRNAFATGGWKDVRFEKGLAVRLNRRYVSRATEKCAPLPRAWTTSRRRAARAAEQAVLEAAYTAAPMRKLLSREEFLATMDKELSNAVTPKLGTNNAFRDVLLFFPRQNKIFKRLRRTVTRQTATLKKAGRAGIVAYVGLSFAWYTFAILWQWRHESSTVAISRGALGTAFRRFGKVLFSAFVGARITQLPRIQLALALAPFGNKAIRSTQQKFRVSETEAFGILAGLMLLTCLGVWALIILGDAALLRTWVIQTYRHQAEILQLDAI